MVRGNSAHVKCSCQRRSSRRGFGSLCRLRVLKALLATALEAVNQAGVCTTQGSQRCCAGRDSQASGCRLNALGWCCFGTLCCIALPLSWLPFMCAFCKPQCQRPVYGYSIDFIGAAAADDAWPTKKASTAAPPIHCMDASLLAECAAAQQDQQQQAQQLEQQRAFCAARCTPSPPPMSIFIPPSAVPACKCICVCVL